jgi:AAHS family 4-hydroxybenzoate transporter-like MFS transporter
MASTAPALNVQDFIDARQIGRFQLRVAILCGLVVFLDGFDTQVIGYIAPMIVKDWGLARSQLGPIFASSLAGLMAGFLLVAPLSDAVGRRRVIIGSTLAFGAFTLLSATSASVGALLLFRFLAGIGLGGALPNALALTGAYCP